MAISNEELEERAYQISKRFENVNSFYLDKMASQIKEIGRLNPSNLNRLRQLAIMGNNIDAINKYLSHQTGKTLEDIYKLYEESAGTIYKDLAYTYIHRGIKQVPLSKNTALSSYIESVKQLTSNTFENMARTTSISKSYKDAIDIAIDTVATGMDSYENVMRRVIRDKVDEGTKITYASGYTRRLDSACRMNILEGVRQVNAGIRKEAGKQYGADGVEIDAHGLCAEDHIDIQGRQYSLEAFERLDNSLQRKIGTCNCKHGVSYIILGVTPKTYDTTMLNNMKSYSEKEIKVGNKTVSRYEASQMMRKLETKQRKLKDLSNCMKKAGFPTSSINTKLKENRNMYKRICSSAGLIPRYDRMMEQVPRIGNLTDRDRYAILRYKSFESYPLNDKLRKKDSTLLDDEDRSFIKALDKALKKLPTYKGVVKRSLTFYSDEDTMNFLQKEILDNPSHIVFPSYISASYGKEFYDPEAEVQLIINSKKSKKLYKELDNGEDEVIYMRNSRFKLNNIMQHGKSYYVYMEEL